MVEVFKTDINSRKLADSVKLGLTRLIPNSSISFDLEDCDKVLRIEADMITAKTVIEELQKIGIACEIMHW